MLIDDEDEDDGGRLASFSLPLTNSNRLLPSLVPGILAILIDTRTDMS